MHLFDTIEIIPYQLHFKKPARTSRSEMRNRRVYFIKSFEEKNQNLSGWGEIAPLDGLSPEGLEFHHKMDRMARKNGNKDTFKELMQFPSFRFGLESARLDLAHGGKRIWYPGSFTQGKSAIPVSYTHLRAHETDSY